jgi:hypothetical protein
VIITLRFYKCSGFSSRLIELSGEYSHVDTVIAPTPAPLKGFGTASVKMEGEHIPYDPGELRLYGARSDRVGGKPSGVWDRQPYSKCPYKDLSLEVTPIQYLDYWKFLWEQRGRPYDWRAILAFAIERNWQEEDSWYCAELKLAALLKAKIMPSLVVKPNKIFPTTLAVAWQALGAT